MSSSPRAAREIEFSDTKFNNSDSSAYAARSLLARVAS